MSEKPVWRTGVLPDLTVRQTQEDIVSGRDPALDAAIAWLQTQAS